VTTRKTAHREARHLGAFALRKSSVALLRELRALDAALTSASDALISPLACQTDSFSSVQ
jgi:hypothetical protein